MSVYVPVENPYSDIGFIVQTTIADTPRDLYRKVASIVTSGAAPDARVPLLGHFANQQAEERMRVRLGIFNTALEGGVTYWADVRSYHWSKPDGSDDLLHYRAVVYDPETDERHTIDDDVIRLGIERLANKSATFGGQPLNPEGRLHLLAVKLYRGEDVDFDAGDADSIVQAGLFNDIVYG